FFEYLAYIAAVSVVLLDLEPCQASININNCTSSGRREVIEALQGAVAADDGRCSRIGRDVLREDGHAIDAAVATALCLGVVNPASSGIGGGAFMLVRLTTGEAEAYDMRETAPASASEDMYASNPLSKSSGALSVAVPGELVGYHQAWQKYGRIPWKRLVLPAVHLAESFIVSPYLAFQMNRSKAEIFADKGLRDIFTSNGKLLQAGDKCHNLKLAKTLKAIAEYGPQVLYNGTIGINLVKDVQRAGGILTFRDLQNYRVRVQKPLSVDIMGYKILGMPPPSAGGAGMILVLNIIASYGVSSASYGAVGLHRLIEAFKHMFAMRMNLGDPDFVNVTNVLSDMLSPKFAAELKKTIYDNMTFDPSHYGGKWNEIDDHGTSHFSIVDGGRNAVSITSTVNSYFGAKLLSQKTGIVLNNEMDDFSIKSNSSGASLPPSPPNFIRPFKRPLSSMTPTILLQDGQLKAVLGASGGIKIISATTELFLNYFIKKMKPLASVMAPRVYHQLIPNVVEYDDWTTVLGDHIELSGKMITALEKRGHKLDGVIGGSICQMIVHDLHSHSEDQRVPKKVMRGKLTAVSDPRKEWFQDDFRILQGATGLVSVGGAHSRYGDGWCAFLRCSTGQLWCFKDVQELLGGPRTILVWGELGASARKESGDLWWLRSYPVKNLHFLFVLRHSTPFFSEACIFVVYSWCGEFGDHDEAGLDQQWWTGCLDKQEHGHGMERSCEGQMRGKKQLSVGFEYSKLAHGGVGRDRAQRMVDCSSIIAKESNFLVPLPNAPPILWGFKPQIMEHNIGHKFLNFTDRGEVCIGKIEFQLKLGPRHPIYVGNQLLNGMNALVINLESFDARSFRKWKIIISDDRIPPKILRSKINPCAKSITNPAHPWLERLKSFLDTLGNKSASDFDKNLSDNKGV
ncbi:hypothetical protein KI387_038724, partial [Taxus chinensis]